MERKTLFKSNDLKVFTEEKIIKGRTTRLLKVKEHNAVVVIPVLPGRRLLLEKQYRPVIGKYIYELPAGHLKTGEAADVAARRELEEETGFAAAEMLELYNAYLAPGLSTSLHRFFIARGLRKGEKHLDKDERIENEIVKFKEAVNMIKDGRIIDVKTIAGMLFAFYFKKL